MKKIIVFSTCLLLSFPLYAELKISYVSGSVEVVRNDESLEPTLGMELQVNDKVKTYEDSRAVLMMDGATRIWVRQDSEMEITSVGKENYFGLLFGKMRAKVQKLQGKKFMVKTPVSIASIRGTDFTMSSDGELAVLEGKVAFSDANESNTMEVLEGQIGAVGDAGLSSRDMTPEEKDAINAEWGAFGDNGNGDNGSNNDGQEGKKEEKKDDRQQAALDLRQELRDMIRDIKKEINEQRERTKEIKEADLAASRVLRDVHGNLVRVEQVLTRPDDKTFKIQNITMRPEGYRYSDIRGWGYNGPTTARIDVAEIKFKMNKPMPDQISEWASYVSANKDDLHPDSLQIQLTNQADVVKITGDWTLKGNPAEKKSEILTEDRLVFNTSINNYKVDADYDPKVDNPSSLYLEGEDKDGEDELWAWGTSPEMRIYRDINGNNRYDTGEASELVRILTEMYVIDNNGAIRNVDSFIDSSEGIFTPVKESAAEQIMLCRRVSDNTDIFKRGNLDLVYIPDVILSVALQLGTEATDLAESDSDNN